MRTSGVVTAAALLLITCTTAMANEYRDHPSAVLDLTRYSQFQFVGIVDRETKLSDGRTLHEAGTAILVSPCFVITNHHVVFGHDLVPKAGKDYSMIFRAGIGDDEKGFEGHTDATPVFWGNMDVRGRNDWALMQLHNCAGTMAEFGWLEETRYSKYQLVEDGKRMIAVGYVGFSYADGHYSSGTVRGIDARTGMMQFDGSLAHGQSGGALLTFEDGTIKLSGLTTAGLNGGSTGSSTFPTWTPEHSNLAQGAFEILNQPAVKDLLDRDKAAFGQPNPAAERLKSALPTLP